MMKIGELSQRTGLSVYTIRYYEKIGLIRKNGKDKSGHREYSDYDVEWIRFLNCLKATEMPLCDILHFVRLREKGDSTIPERLSLMKIQKNRLADKIGELTHHMDHLDYKIRHFKKILK